MLVVACAMLGAGSVAEAGRKRVVVLDFEGPKGDKFHDDLVKLIKKTHTVVPTDKWNGTAEELDASGLSEKNLKKVAKKLKVDAIVEGKIEKRRDEFIIRLKLHEGRSGEVIGSTIDTKAGGPRIDDRAQRDLKDELVDVIGNVESNHMGGSDNDDDDKLAAKKGAKKADDDDDKPVAKKGAKKADDDDDKPVAKKSAKKTDDDEDDDKPARKGFAKHTDDELGNEKVAKKGAKKADDDDKLPPKKTAAKKADDDDDKLPPKKTAAAKKTDDDDKLPPRKIAAAKKTDDDDDGDKPALEAKRKKVAVEDDEGNSAEADADTVTPLSGDAALSPGERALDAVLGLSLSARTMSFVFSSTLAQTQRPPGYRGGPVPGAMLDATVYPLAVGHKRTDMLKNIGLDLMYDRVLTANSKDPAGKVYSTTESRFGLAGVFRYPFNRTALSPVVIGSLGYSSQSFSIASSGGTMVGVPNVSYSIFEPGAGLRYPITDKIIAGADLKLMLILGAGQIQNADQYGAASVLGFEGALGADYLITRNIFARAAFRFETIGYTFNGTGMLSNNRDGDPTTKDVVGARDTYIGGMATVGYLY